MSFVFALPILIFLLSAVIAFLVLFIILCIKKPKFAALLLIIPVVLIILGALFFINVPVTRVARHSTSTVAPAIHRYSEAAPIWSEGIEQQFEADIYPSKVSAICAVGKRIVKELPDIIEEIDNPQEITVFSNSQDSELVHELRAAIAKLNPSIPCRVGSGNYPELESNKIGVYFYIDYNTINLSSQGSQNGTIRSNIIAKNLPETRVMVDFAEKPWVENLASYASSRPSEYYVIAQSNETCLSEAEANRQAMDEACTHVGQALLSRQNPNKVDYQNIVQSGIVVDKFIQSFDGSNSKIWRQAILLDISPDKLNRLNAIISGVSIEHSKKQISAIASIAGLFLLIIIVYAFLNAATKGYYTWALRILGIIIAAALLIFTLMFIA